VLCHRTPLVYHHALKLALMYVLQPERLSLSGEFKSVLKQMVSAKKLGQSISSRVCTYNSPIVARIVVDEAHCISQMGRDYRYINHPSLRPV